MSVSRRRALALAVLCLGARVARAQEDDGTAPVAGAWRAMPAPVVANGLPVSASRPMLAAMARVMDVLRAAPVLAHPVGFVVLPQLGTGAGPWWIEDPDARGFGRGPHLGTASLTLLPYVRGEEGGTPELSHEGPGVGISANTLKCLYPGWDEPYAADAAGRMFVQPERLDDEHGHPVYAAALREPCVVVTARTAPLWVPVSRERLLRALIATDRETLDSVRARDPLAAMLANAREMQRTGPPAARKQAAEMEARILAARASADSAQGSATALVQRRLASHQRLLAAMSAADRAAPAVVRGVAMMDDPFAEDPDHPFAPTAIVAPNPAFFDASRPAAPQVLTFVTRCNSTACSAWGNVMRRRIFDAIDWGALEAVVR